MALLPYVNPKDKQGIVASKINNVIDYLNRVVLGGAATWGAIGGTLSNQTDLDSALAGKEATGTAAAAVAAHVAAGDPHTQYLTAAEGNAAYDAIGAAAAAVSAHEAAGDPHTGYVLESALTESVQDVVGAFIADSTTLDATYDDAGNTETIEVKTAYNPVGKHSIWIPAGAIAPRSDSGCSALATYETATNKVNVDVLDFDQTTSEYAQFRINMPKGWNESTITAKFVWTALSSSGTVTWGLQAIALSDDDALDTAFGTAQTVTDTLLATGDVHRTAETSAITIGGSPAEEDLVVFQVYRDVADTLAADARLIGVLLYYTTNAATDA